MSLTEDVRTTVLCIPAGQVTTYGDIGATVGAPARQVGRIMSLLSDDIPWWRVVRADGTPPSCHGGIAPQLLRAENTPMRGQRIDMPLARVRRPPRHRP